KFFLDRAGDTASDAALAAAMQLIPVILQARIDDGEPAPHPLPSRFTLPFSAATAISGSSGWIPAPRFAAAAAGIGFADYDGLPVALLETYRERTVKSLLLASLELAMGGPADIDPGHHVTAGSWSFALDPLNRAAATPAAWPPLDYLPFHALLEDGGRADRLVGKVVILGYDGARIPMLETPLGAISAHRLFIRVLEALFEQGGAP
ncbi:MAG: hypothetical protein KJO38_09985, partial [Gammaproteobacteria bacterium]|nr:hypothetical protein [Gammaproteobacteria bacterium]